MVKQIKPILLIAVGILALILAVQTASLITGMVGGTVLASTSADVNNSPVSAGNVAFTMTTAVGCSTDTGSNINCSVDVVDENGYGNISAVSAKIYGPSKTSVTCTADNRTNCYTVASCTTGPTINVTARTYYCAAANPLKFYSDNGTWTCNVTATDGINTSYATTTQSRSALYSIDVGATIAWGTMGVQQTKVVNDKVRNCGNRFIDVTVNGTDMTCGSGTTIGAGNITSGMDVFGNTTALSGTLARLQTNHAIAVDGLANEEVNATTYWNLTVPRGITGSCTGSVWFVATENT